MDETAQTFVANPPMKGAKNSEPHCSSRVLVLVDESNVLSSLRPYGRKLD